MLYLEDAEKQKFENLIEFLKGKYDYPQNLILISLKELKQASKNDGLFLSASPKSLRYAQIDKLRNRLSVFDLNVEGIILN